MTLAALIDDLVIANRILCNEGVVDGFGHVSVRHPERPDCYRGPRPPVGSLEESRQRLSW
jgi:hypothetical protein